VELYESELIGLGGRYFGGCSSLFSQPNTLSVFMGSGRSQSKHWNVRCPLPSGGRAKTIGDRQMGQIGRSPWGMTFHPCMLSKE